MENELREKAVDLKSFKTVPKLSTFITLRLRPNCFFIFNSVGDCSERRRLQREKRVQVRPRSRLRRGGSRTARGKRPPETKFN